MTQNQQLGLKVKMACHPCAHLKGFLNGSCKYLDVD